MDRTTRNLFAVVIVVVIVVTGGAALVLTGGSVDQRHQPVGPDAVTGVIVAVDGEGISSVRGFTLRRPDGELLAFSLAELADPSTFPPGHLIEHQATADPVLVRFRVDDGVRYAITLEDVGP
jgi:hypothetical protein